MAGVMELPGVMECDVVVEIQGYCSVAVVFILLLVMHV